MKTLIALILWCMLFVICWPLAIVLIFLFPVVWLLLLPFKVVGLTLELIFRVITSILTFPFKVLKSN